MISKNLLIRYNSLSTLGTIRTRLYYFPNGRKCALFGSYLHVQFHKNRPFSHASKKMFSKMFSRKWFLSVVTYPEEQIASLRICMMLHSLITVFHKSFMMSSLKTVNAISYNGLPEML